MKLLTVLYTYCEQPSCLVDSHKITSEIIYIFRSRACALVIFFTKINDYFIIRLKIQF